MSEITVTLTYDEAKHAAVLLRHEGRMKRSRGSLMYCHKGTLGYNEAEWELGVAGKLDAILEKHENPKED